jgi:hypothetical protein
MNIIVKRDRTVRSFGKPLSARFDLRDAVHSL